MLRAAIEDLVGGTRRRRTRRRTPKIRVGTLAIPLDTVEIVDLTPATFDALKQQVLGGRAGTLRPRRRYPPDVLRAGRRPLLQFPLETLETTMANHRAIGIAAARPVSGRLVGYALGSALENHDEEGVASDPRLRREQHVLPAGDGDAAVGAERRRSSRTALLDAMRDRAICGADSSTSRR